MGKAVRNFPAYLAILITVTCVLANSAAHPQSQNGVFQVRPVSLSTGLTENRCNRNEVWISSVGRCV